MDPHNLYIHGWKEEILSFKLDLKIRFKITLKSRESNKETIMML